MQQHKKLHLRDSTGRATLKEYRLYHEQSVMQLPHLRKRISKDNYPSTLYYMAAVLTIAFSMLKWNYILLAGLMCS